MRQTPRGFNALVVITGTVVFRTPPPQKKNVYFDGLLCMYLNPLKGINPPMLVWLLYYVRYMYVIADTCT